MIKNDNHKSLKDGATHEDSACYYPSLVEYLPVLVTYSSSPSFLQPEWAERQIRSSHVKIPGFVTRGGGSTKRVIPVCIHPPNGNEYIVKTGNQIKLKSFIDHFNKLYFYTTKYIVHILVN